MTGSGATGSSRSRDEEEAARRRREQVFGEVLPESTSDDRDHDAAPADGGGAHDEWLRRNVPPHHG